MTKKSAKERTGNPQAREKSPPPSSDDVLGDLVDSDFDIEFEDDGKVRVHAKCAPGDDPAACAEKVRFLVEALGAELVAPPELPR